MRLGALFLLAAFAVACASSGEAGEDRQPETVQLTVINEFLGTVTAYAVWGQNRTRLGDVGQNRTRVFIAPVRSDRVAIGLEAIGAPPPPTSAGSSRNALSPYAQSPTIEVVGGDAIEFRLSAAGVLTTRRLEPGL